LLCFLEFLFIYCSAVFFSLWSILLLSSSTTVFSSLSYILGIESLFFFIPTLFFLLYLSFYTSHTTLLLSLFFLLFSLSSSILSSTDCTIYFSLVFQGKTLVPSFYGFEPYCFYILYNLHRLLLSPLWSIFSQVEVHLLRAYSTHHSTPVSFSI